MSRWMGTGLLLVALLPGDLAVARLALRDARLGLTARHGIAATHAAADRVVMTGETLLGRGVHVLGTAMFDAACRVADVAVERMPGRVWNRDPDRGVATDGMTRRIIEDRLASAALERRVAARGAAEQARRTRVVCTIAHCQARARVVLALRELERVREVPAPAPAPATPTGS